MSTETSSHFQELLQSAADMEAFHAGKFLVSTTPSLVPRTDHGKTIFQEGEDFSDFECEGYARSCLTPQVAPFSLPSVATHLFVEGVKRVLGEGARIPEQMERIEKVAPHVLVWWQRQGGLEDGRDDFLWLAGASERHRQDTYSVVARQMNRGARIIHEVTGTTKPIIQGSWGHATPEERAAQGKSRGGPTNKHGHLHILDLDEKYTNTELRDDLPIRDRLDHYGLWNKLVHDKFKEPIAMIMQNCINAYLPAVRAEVEPFTELFRRDNGGTLCSFGYNLHFGEKGASAKDAFASMAQVAYSMESFYQEANKYYEAFHQSSSSAEAHDAHLKLHGQAVRAGLAPEDAESLSQFVLKVRPTYGQLISWRDKFAGDVEHEADFARLDQKIKRYERAARNLGKIAEKYPLIAGIIGDTVTSSDDKGITRTWPVHLGASFYMDDVMLTSDGLTIRNIKLVPNIDTTKASQNITGTINRRPIEAEVIAPNS